MAQDNQFRDTLLERISLADIVGKRVKLKKKGREFTGLCPFHSEKTPSFSVVEDKNFYHCFGCGASGNAISFIMETEGLDYRAAIETLAKSVGMEVPAYRPIDPKVQQRQDNEYDILQKTADYFHAQLYTDEGKQAYDTLIRRGLNDNDIKQFQLGYAPKSSTALLEHFKGADDTTLQMLESVSLIRKSDRDGSHYGFFRDRIMFPIHNRKGQVIAFGGRYMGQQQDVGKYINSADHELFHKGENLYNYHRAVDSIKQTKRLIIAEGYMDAIALSKHGFSAVAPLGTAMTEDQMRQAWRLDPVPIMAFDGDNAGKRAAARTAVRALPLLAPNHAFRFIFLPNGEDPDSYLQAHGALKFKSYLDQAQNIEDFLWDSELEKAPLANYADKAGFRDRLMKLCEDIANPQLKRTYSNGFSEKLFHYFRTSFKKEAKRQKITKPDLPSVVHMESAGFMFLLVRLPDLMDKYINNAESFFDKELDKFRENLHIYCLSTLDNDLNKLDDYMDNTESANLWKQMNKNLILSDKARTARRLFENKLDDDEKDKIIKMVKQDTSELEKIYQGKVLSKDVSSGIKDGNVKDSVLDARVQALAELNRQSSTD